MSIIKNNSREECRKMRRKCKLFVLNGIKYTIQEPITRPTMRMLTKGGLVVTLDFDKNFEWLNQVTKRWSGVKKYQHETADRISGISIKTSMGDVLVHVIKLNGEQTYLLNCYILGGNLCDTQILVDISGAQAKYIVAQHTSQFWKQKCKICHRLDCYPRLVNQLWTSTSMFIEK